MSATAETAQRPSLPARVLERLGAPVRRGVLVTLSAASLTAGIALEIFRRATWRPTVRAEFRRELRLSLLGGLGTVLVTAALIGVSMVYQAISWLAYAGQEGLVGRILVTVLVREVAPVLVGLILLGRSGTVTVAEFGEIKASGHLRVLEAQGLDPFTLLVLPRVLALAVSGFTLGMLFLAMAIATGYLTASLLGLVQHSAGDFLENLVGATNQRDFPLFAAKLTLIGGLIALTAAITGMSATRRDTPSYLLPRAFVRGTMAVLLTSALLSVAVT